MEVTKCLKRPQSLLGGVAGAVMLGKLCKWKAREFELRFFRAIPGGRRHFGHRRRDSVAYHGRRVCVSP